MQPRPPRRRGRLVPSRTHNSACSMGLMAFMSSRRFRVPCLNFTTNTDASACVYSRPFRLSCIAFLMATARRDASGASQEEPTIASVYEGSPRTSSVSKWIEENRVKEGKNTKDLLVSDDSERRFLAAINAGAEITRRQVRKSPWDLVVGADHVIHETHPPDPRGSFSRKLTACFHPDDVRFVRACGSSTGRVSTSDVDRR